MTQTAARPYMSISVQIPTPDAPALIGAVIIIGWVYP